MSNRTAAVVHQPLAGAGMQRGIHALTALMRPTIGPHPRAVAIASTGLRAPELLDNGGLIARRMLQLQDRNEDVGAMFLRGLLWRVYQHAGDGVATTSVLFQTIYDGGLHAIAAGCNAMLLRHHLHEGMTAILDHLEQLTIAVDGQSHLTRIALTVCADPALADHLGDLFAVLGEHGHIELRAGQSRGLASAPIEGSYWESPLLSKTAFAGTGSRRVELQRPSIFISDLEFEQPQELVPILTAARAGGAGSLVIVTRKLAGSCGAFLTANSGPGFQAIAVRTPGIGPPDRHDPALRDLEALTGGRALRSQAGDTVASVQPADLGRSRRAWADHQHTGIIGPGGDPSELRAHVRQLRCAHRRSDDPEARAELSQRLARLSGSTAMLWVDGTTTPAIDARKELARRTVATLRAALQGGALPGAGVGLLACRPQLAARLATAVEPEARAAYRILVRALEEPARAIIANSGYDCGLVLAEIERAGTRFGLNAETGRVVDAVEAGILDAAVVIRMAIRTAVEGAAQALTIDTLIHSRKPAVAVSP